MDLLEDIFKGCRNSHTIGDGKTNTVILSWSRIGILTENDDFHFVEGTAVENLEEMFAFGKYMVMLVFGFDELYEVCKIGFVKFFLEYLSPTFFYFDFHFNFN